MKHIKLYNFEGFKLNFNFKTKGFKFFLVIISLCNTVDKK